MRGFRFLKRAAWCLASAVLALSSCLQIQATPEPEVNARYGLTSRPESKPFLLMPSDTNGPLPKLLSQTGAFKDVRTLTPSECLIPHDLNVAFWSDGAEKSRWVAVPNQGGH